MKKLNSLTRREFLERTAQAGLVLGGSFILYSCGHSPDPGRPVWAPWEDISEYTDNTLEGSFSLSPNIAFDNMDDFIGKSFEQEIDNQVRKFTIDGFDSRSFVVLSEDSEFEIKLTEPRIRLTLTEGDAYKFESRFDLAGRDDADFSGLEKVLLVSRNPDGIRGYIEFRGENKYNGEVQDDAYFRMRAGDDWPSADAVLLSGALPPPPFLIRRIEKLRIPDAQKTEECEVKPISEGIEDGSITKHSQEDVEKNTDQTLKNGFYLQFPFPFEFPIPEQKGFYLPRESLSYNFSRRMGDRDREFVMRYLAVNSKENIALVEILEEPKVEHLEMGAPRAIEYRGREYVVTLKGFGETRGYLKMPDLVLEVENEGEKREIVVSGADPLNPNKNPWFNVDPDLAYYWGRTEHEIKSLRVHRFLLSSERVNVPDFYSSKYHTGMRKQIISDKNLTDPKFTQLTIATRYNGDGQSNAYSKIGVEYNGKTFVMRDLEKIVV